MILKFCILSAPILNDFQCILASLLVLLAQCVRPVVSRCRRRRPLSVRASVRPVVHYVVVVRPLSVRPVVGYNGWGGGETSVSVLFSTLMSFLFKEG